MVNLSKDALRRHSKIISQTLSKIFGESVYVSVHSVQRMIERNIKIDKSFIEALGAAMRKLDYIISTGSYDDSLDFMFGKLKIPLVYDYDQDQYIIKTVIDVSRQSWR